MKEVRVKHITAAPRKIGVAKVKGVEEYVYSSGGPATTILAKEERSGSGEAAPYVDARVGGPSLPRVLTRTERWTLQGGRIDDLTQLLEKYPQITEAKLRELTAMGTPRPMAAGVMEQWGVHMWTQLEEEASGRAGAPSLRVPGRWSTSKQAAASPKSERTFSITRVRVHG